MVQDKPISVINEKIVVDVFIKLLNLRLSSYPTTLTVRDRLRNLLLLLRVHDAQTEVIGGWF